MLMLFCSLKHDLWGTRGASENFVAIFYGRIIIRPLGLLVRCRARRTNSNEDRHCSGDKH